jgi:hypothetical protein
MWGSPKEAYLSHPSACQHRRTLLPLVLLLPPESTPRPSRSPKLSAAPLPLTKSREEEEEEHGLARNGDKACKRDAPADAPAPTAAGDREEASDGEALPVALARVMRWSR